MNEFEKEKIIIWSFNGNRFDYIFLYPYLLRVFQHSFNFVGKLTNIKSMSHNNVFYKDFYALSPVGSLNIQAKLW